MLSPLWCHSTAVEIIRVAEEPSSGTGVLMAPVAIIPDIYCILTNLFFSSAARSRSLIDRVSSSASLLAIDREGMASYRKSLPEKTPSQPPLVKLIMRPSSSTLGNLSQSRSSPLSILRHTVDTYCAHPHELIQLTGCRSSHGEHRFRGY